MLREKQEVESFVVLQGNEGEVEIVRQGINVVVNEDANIIFFFLLLFDLNRSIKWPILSSSSYLLVMQLCEPSCCFLDLDYPFPFHFL